MKTTLDLDDRLLADAKAAAARDRMSVTRWIERALRLHLQARPSVRRSIPLPVSTGRRGMALGIDPTSNRSMLEACDAAPVAGWRRP